MEYSAKLTLVFLACLCEGKVTTFNEVDENSEFLNKFLDLLLSCDCAYDLMISGEADDATEPQPILANGIWTCGSCHTLDQTKLLYTESYQVDFENTHQPANFMINLYLPESRCITFSADQMSSVIVSRTSGACESRATDVGFKVVSREAQQLNLTVKAYGL